ncbi:MAG: hypothetical protein PHZ26_01820 [Candidatus Gracilibacteria bacterium]|nr:hypothetical protein [Candidatus Gracilibacteria bacterium]MDD2908472.1 hypothetical protein [Candidatus Gracilibacteria bacterium]
MKKILISIVLASSFILVSCNDGSSTNNDAYKQINESFTSTGNTDSGIEKAKISNDINYEATEEIEEVSTGETATVTSFGSGGTEDNGSGQ